MAIPDWEIRARCHGDESMLHVPVGARSPMPVVAGLKVPDTYGKQAPLVEPYTEENLQPASYDVTIGNVFRVYDNQKVSAIDLSDPSTYENLTSPVEIA